MLHSSSAGSSRCPGHTSTVHAVNLLDKHLVLAGTRLNSTTLHTLAVLSRPLPAQLLLGKSVS